MSRNLVRDTAESVMEIRERDSRAVPTDETANAVHALAIDEARASFRPTLRETTGGADTRSARVWLPGAHSDAGDGYPERGLAHDPANLPRSGTTRVPERLWRVVPEPRCRRHDCCCGSGQAMRTRRRGSHREDRHARATP